MNGTTMRVCVWACVCSCVDVLDHNNGACGGCMRVCYVCVRVACVRVGVAIIQTLSMLMCVRVCMRARVRV